jgi:thymidylate synthase
MWQGGNAMLSTLAGFIEAKDGLGEGAVIHLAYHETIDQIAKVVEQIRTCRVSGRV